MVIILLKIVKEVNSYKSCVMIMQCSIVKNFFNMVDNIICGQKLPRDYGTGDLLYHAEADLLEVISENPDYNVSKLSEKCSVTKSAITQMTSKMIDKGLLQKYNLDTNKKEKMFLITEKGELVQEGNRKYHEESNAVMHDYLCGLNPEEKKIVNEFIEKVNECVPFSVFNCHCNCGCESEEMK